MAKKIKRVDDSIQEEVASQEEAKAGKVEHREMREIKFDPTKHFISPKDSDTADIIDPLLSMLKDEAASFLTKLVSDKKISEFRIAPIGASTTDDFKPGRVSALVDATGKIVSASFG
jgi:hypothetical protein